MTIIDCLSSQKERHFFRISPWIFLPYFPKLGAVEVEAGRPTHANERRDEKKDVFIIDCLSSQKEMHFVRIMGVPVEVRLI